MNKISLLGLVVSLLLAGCGEKETTAPVTAPPPPSQEKRPTSPDTRIPPPPPDAPAIPPAPTTAAALPADILQRYQALANDVDARARLIDDVAMHAIDDSNKPQAAKVLTELLRAEPNPELKVSILDELGLLESPAALETVLTTIDPAQPETVREAAVDAADSLLSDLGNSGDKSTLGLITRALDARYPTSVRETAISALEDLEDLRAVPHLQRLLNDPDEQVREAAQSAIEWLQEQ